MAVVLKDIDELLDAKLSVEGSKNLLEMLHSLSLNLEFCEELVNSYPGIVIKILNLAINTKEVSNIAVEFLINVSSHSGLISKVLNSKPYQYSDFIEHIVSLITKSPDSNIKSMSTLLLANISRENTSFFDQWKKCDVTSLDCIFKTALHLNGASVQKEEKNREEALMIVLNLSQEISCQKFLIENLNYLNDILTLSESCSENYLMYLIMLLKNLLKTSSYHEDLLNATDVLIVLLKPLAGLNDYEDKIIKDFPEKLKKYVGSHNNVSSDLRSIILECLYLLSATKLGRVTMRDNNVYDILKNISELDLLDGENDNCLDCIGLLIRTEDEIGFDDLLTVHIPEDIQEKFNN